MDARRRAGARSTTAFGWMVQVVFFLGVFGGCGGGGEPARVTRVEDACMDKCAPGDWRGEDGCCQPAGLPLDMPCPPGEWPDDHGICRPAGLPLDMPCPPGEWLREDSGCQPAGVPPEDCAEGFASDGNGGCDVILPAQDCPKGQMAIPGEAVCHGVAPCGSSDYGDIPVAPATTQFVNQAYAGADSNGTEAKPWKTIQQGIDAAAEGAIVAVAAGNYVENAVIEDKPVVLWGRCPALVKVAGTKAQNAAVKVRYATAATSEIRGIAITGSDVGLWVAGASGVTVDRVWIHDTKDFGLVIFHQYGQTSATVTASLIEATHSLGVLVVGSDAVLSGIAVRDILPDGSGNFGRGIHVQSGPGTNARSNVQVTASVVERTHDSGVFVAGSDAVLSGVAVRDILPDGSGNFGRGIHVQSGPETNARSNVQVTASVVERTHDLGIFVEASDAELVGVVVRDVLPNGAGDSGRGILVRSSIQTNERAKVRVTASVVERTRAHGVYILSSDAKLLGVVVRDILPDGTGVVGAGIAAHDSLQTDERAHVQVTASVIERTHCTGVYVEGSDAELVGVVVRDILPDEEGNWGRGIQVRVNSDTYKRGKVQLTASVVERTHDIGVFVSGSDAEIWWAAVRDVLLNGEGMSGSGIAVQNDPDTNARASVLVIASMVERTHTIGVFIAGSDAKLSGVVVRDILADGAGKGGDGIVVLNDWQTHERADVRVAASVVERADRIGVIASGSDVEILAVVVRDIQPNSAGEFGAGIQVQNDPDTNERAIVLIRGSLVERSRNVGVFVFASAAIIEGSVVRQTSAHVDGTLGDGIAVWTDNLPAEVTITGTVVDSNAGAGLANWGAPVHFTSTLLSCNVVDLQGEVYQDSPFSFPDSHHNICGCPPVADLCRALSTGSSPPPPLDDLPFPDSPSSP